MIDSLRRNGPKMFADTNFKHVITIDSNVNTTQLFNANDKFIKLYQSKTSNKVTLFLSLKLTNILFLTIKELFLCHEARHLKVASRFPARQIKLPLKSIRKTDHDCDLWHKYWTKFVVKHTLLLCASIRNFPSIIFQSWLNYGGNKQF